MQKFYLVWIETREIQCVDNASALTNTLDSIYTDKVAAYMRASERAAYYRYAIKLKRGTVCGGYFDAVNVYVYEATPDEITGELKQTDELYKAELKM